MHPHQQLVAGADSYLVIVSGFAAFVASSQKSSSVPAMSGPQVHASSSIHAGDGPFVT